MTTLRLEESEEARDGWLGSHGQQLKIQRDISAAKGVSLRSVGSKSQAGLFSLEHQNQEKNPNNI